MFKFCVDFLKTSLFDNTIIYCKTSVKLPLSKRPKIDFQDQFLLNAGQKYCRMLHSSILLAFIKLPFVIKTFVLSIFEWPFYTGFTVVSSADKLCKQFGSRSGLT